MFNTKPKKKLHIMLDQNGEVIIMDKTDYYSPTERALTSMAESLRMIALAMTGNVAVDLEKVTQMGGQAESPPQTMTSGDTTYVREPQGNGTWLKYEISKDGIRRNMRLEFADGREIEVAE